MTIHLKCLLPDTL